MRLSIRTGELTLHTNTSSLEKTFRMIDCTMADKTEANRPSQTESIEEEEVGERPDHHNSNVFPSAFIFRLSKIGSVKML